MTRILKPIIIENYMSFRAARYTSLSVYCIISEVYIIIDSGKIILNKSLFIKVYVGLLKDHILYFDSDEI